MNTERLKLIASELEKSPMFQLSLSSKELFHSNFLYWIWRESPTMFRNIINCITDGKAHSDDWPESYVVAREHKHYDLSVWEGEPDKSKVLLILENKVKSIPNKKQLDEYHKDKDAKYILLSFSKDFPEKKLIEDDEWCIVHYDDLARALTQWNSMTGYYREIISDYCRFILNLQELVTESKINHTDNWTDDSGLSATFESLRIGDLYKKLRYGQILCFITERPITKTCSKPINWTSNIHDILEGEKCGRKQRDSSKAPKPFQEVYVNYGMTNSQGFFEVKIKVSNDTVFLIQVQGNQYRRAIERKGTYKENIDWLNNQNSNLYKFFAHSKEEFPDFRYSDSLKKVSPFRPKKKDNEQNGFCKFGNWFIYQYVEIEDSTTVKSVAKAVIKDIYEVLKLNQHECCRPSL